MYDTLNCRAVTSASRMSQIPTRTTLSQTRTRRSLVAIIFNTTFGIALLVALLFALALVCFLPSIIISTISAWILLSLFIEMSLGILISAISTVGYIYTVFLVIDTVYRWSGGSMTLEQIARMRAPP